MIRAHLENGAILPQFPGLSKRNFRILRQAQNKSAGERNRPRSPRYASRVPFPDKAPRADFPLSKWFEKRSGSKNSLATRVFGGTPTTAGKTPALPINAPGD
jgi:hypothetical protein